MATNNHFYDLPVYKVGRSFRKKVSLIAKKHFPKSEEYLLKSQILDPCRSITANIAEGFGRFHHQENMITSYDEKYISKNILADINKDYKECLKQLNGYIKYLKTAKQEGKIINNK
ncbi:MAG TPA: four helix bundle protein [Chitinophagaceae bacterium]|jgi:hypothetical protein|nr:four helix bundle protein [Chitinophagaceae bacterium]